MPRARASSTAWRAVAPSVPHGHQGHLGILQAIANHRISKRPAEFDGEGLLHVLVGLEHPRHGRGLLLAVHLGLVREVQPAHRARLIGDSMRQIERRQEAIDGFLIGDLGHHHRVRQDEGILAHHHRQHDRRSSASLYADSTLSKTS